MQTAEIALSKARKQPNKACFGRQLNNTPFARTDASAYG
jgi:hypothetical protein